MEKEPVQIIETVATELILAMGFSATVEVSLQEGPQPLFLCVIRVVEGQNFLIGQYGMNLAALQHLVRILVRRRLGEKLDIIVDVNDYFREKKQTLEKEATLALEECLQSNSAVTLRPMLSYERKVVHAFLASHEGITTESTGEGDERRVMILPNSQEKE